MSTEAAPNLLIFVHDAEASTQHQDVYVHIFEKNPQFRLIIVDYKGAGESTNLLFVQSSDKKGSTIYWRRSYESLQQAVTVAHTSAQLANELARDIMLTRAVAQTN